MQAGAPPPYTPHKPHNAPYPPPHPFNGSHSAGPFSSPPRSLYGPTPIGVYPSEGGVGVLPFYNPEALHADELIREATQRARWRFLEAFMWALFIWCILGAMTSATVIGALKQ
ncbi:unnamed protein product [Rhizoctonia solani]|uniref:Transmembrane protein n=1 Tax=Rhizoctonia solani TaxID=456999 RepID=A0A8H7IKJ8_9AGAM